MKKFLLSMLTAVMAIAFVGCEYDDSELTGRVENLEGRVQTLEQLCQQMNTNITAMQAIINALQTQDAITAVTPITEGGEVIGYTITFVKGDPITIYHGQDGKDGADGADGADGEDGYTPVIGVDQDEDGEYYWTLDGEWLTDKDGNKIPTSGKDGADGEDGTTEKGGMPELKIQGGYWYVSYDGGETWERLGRATGYDGSDGDAFFESVKDWGDVVEFKLSDGKFFYVPKHVALEVEVKEALMDAKIIPGAEFLVTFELKNAGDNANGVDYVVISDYATTDVKSANLVTVKGIVPANAKSGDEIKVTLLATKDGKSVMASHTFVVSATAATNADELNDALANGGTIILSEGVDYGTITAGELKDVTIDGNGATMIFNTTANSKLEDVTLRNIKFEYTGATVDCGVVINANAQIDNLVIEDCDFIGNGEKKGRGLSGSNSTASIVIRSCDFKDLGYPIYTVAGGGYESLTIEECTFNNIKSWAIMPQYSYSGDLTVNECVFEDCLGGGLVKSGDITANHTFAFTNNTITGCTIAGDHNWFSVDASAGTAVISGNKKDGVDWTPTAADGLKTN